MDFFYQQITPLFEALNLILSYEPLSKLLNNKEPK